MIFKDENEVIALLQANQAVTPRITTAREDHKELNALINGLDFKSELINKIEGIESDAKIQIRQKYSRSIKDFFERLFLPIDNVFSSNGGVKKYTVPEAKSKEVLSAIADIKDGKSIERYVESVWMPLYHSDPNGIIMMEYKKDTPKPYPTYKSINSVRNYLAKGQQVEWIIFEPVKDKTRLIWRVVDDKNDYTFQQVGNVYTLVVDKTFEHPFGEVPAIIISDIVNMPNQVRLSAIDKIIPISKEYARDQSVKTIYKFLHGFPVHWRYVSVCKGCGGSKKKGDKSCGDCDGHGYYRSKDVTDMVALPMPDKDGVKIAPEISGYISPDKDTWKLFNEELDFLEQKTFETHWGTKTERQQNETATGRFIDIQPVSNRLNKYANTAEWVEWKLSEWVVNYIDNSKKKEVSAVLISYGRRYIIDAPDTLLGNYLNAKKEGANNTVLDRLLEEYLSAKFKNDPEWLRVELIKHKLEPFVHLSIAETKDVFETEAALKKLYFSTWFNDLVKVTDEKELRVKFETDWQTELKKIRSEKQAIPAIPPTA